MATLTEPVFDENLMDPRIVRKYLALCEIIFFVSFLQEPDVTLIVSCFFF